MRVGGCISLSFHWLLFLRCGFSLSLTLFCQNENFTIERNSNEIKFQFYVRMNIFEHHTTAQVDDSSITRVQKFIHLRQCYRYRNIDTCLFNLCVCAANVKWVKRRMNGFTHTKFHCAARAVFTFNFCSYRRFLLLKP